MVELAETWIEIRKALVVYHVINWRNPMFQFKNPAFLRLFITGLAVWLVKPPTTSATTNKT